MKISTHIDNMPDELRSQVNWVQYDLVPDPKRPDKKAAKRPCVKYASAEHKRNRRTLDHLLTRRPTAGFQIVVEKDAEFIFVDIDKCRNPETEDLQPFAREIVDKLNSYTEISASGKGLHIVCRGTLPEDFHVEGNAVEIYSGNIRNKLIAMTGNLLNFTTGILRDGQQEATALLTKLKAEVGSLPLQPPAQKTLEDIAVDVLSRAAAEDAEGPCDENAPYIMLDENGQLDILDVAAGEIETEDMPENVLSGRLVEIYEKYLSSFPRAYGYLALIAVAATKVPVQTNFRANLYSCPVGGVHSGKSQSFEQAAKLLGLCAPILTTVKSGSAEGLFGKFNDADGANRMVFVDELGHLLGKANIENSSFSYVLNSAFYSDDIELIIAKSKKVNAKCRLSVFGGVVDDQFGDSFKEKSLGGLYDRFIFGLCPKPFTYLYRPMEAEPLELEACAVRVAPSVYDARDEWVKSGLIGNARTAEIAIRTAVISASIDGKSTLEGKDLTSALAWAKYQETVQRMLLPNPGRNQNAEAENRIRNTLRKHSKTGEWLEARRIEQYGHIKRDFSTVLLEHVLAAMQRSGEIQRMELDSKNGKLKKLIRFAQSEEQKEKAK